MRVLFLTQVLPYPLDAGPKVRAYFSLRHLARIGHQVTLASFVRDSDTEGAAAHLRDYCQTVITVRLRRTPQREALAIGRSLLTGVPLLITRDRVRGMLNTVRELGRAGFDVIHADQLWMAPYALAAAEAPASGQRRPHLILDQHNAVYLVPQRLAAAARNPLSRLAYRRETARMKAFEAQTCRKFDQVVTVTEQDRQMLLALYPNQSEPVLEVTIPICVDPSAVPRDQAPLNQEEILFVGGMHWPPNADGVHWFVQHVLPEVRKRMPGAQFRVVGKAPPQLSQGESLNVHLAGYVEDLEPYWSRRPIFVVPLRAGGGMRVKILEAWARSLPVVSTEIGAEGLACVSGQNILLANKPEEFAEAIGRLNEHPALAGKIARGGRETVERHYDWRTEYAAWDRVYAISDARATGLPQAASTAMTGLPRMCCSLCRMRRHSSERGPTICSWAWQNAATA